MAQETITITAADSDGNIIDSMTVTIETEETITLSAGNS